MKKITTTQLKKQLANEARESIIINVLPETSFEIETIPESENFCVYKTSFVDDVKKAIKDKKKDIVVFGQNKAFGAAERAANLLEEAEYKNIFVYVDGIDGWKQAGNKVVGSKKAAQNEIHKKNFKVNTTDSYVEWEGSNIFNKHYGTLGIKSGKITATKKAVTGGEIVIDMHAIVCDDLKDKGANKGLINHLKSSDFFDVKKYPTAKITFQKAQENSDVVSDLTYKVKAKMTIKGVTKPVELLIHGHYEDKKLIAQGSLVFDRSKWNVQYGSGRFFEALGQHLVHDQVRLRFKVVGE